jgi:hypothetical protein
VAGYFEKKGAAKDMSIGTYAWNDEIARALMARPDHGRLSLVPRPGFMQEPGAAQWSDLRRCSWLAGPTEAVLGQFLSKAWNHRREINCACYAPESVETSGNVPPWQNKWLELCLDWALRITRWLTRARFVYAPGFTLLCYSWNGWNEPHVLDFGLIRRLARKLRSGDVWVFRVKKLEFDREPGPGFFLDVQQFVNCVLDANPGVIPVVHVSAPSAEHFLAYAGVLPYRRLFAGTEPDVEVGLLEEILDASL